ncbi:MAG: transposase [Methylococcales bacterium]|nr:transposase [Methylococcales bacterium]
MPVDRTQCLVILLTGSGSQQHYERLCKEKSRKKGGQVFTIDYRIPPYSPELNNIEIVWRKIKYKWLPFSAYDSYSTLKKELFDVLTNIGKTYKIKFS